MRENNRAPGISADMRRWIERQEKVSAIRRARADYRTHVRKVLRAFMANLEAAEREAAECAGLAPLTLPQPSQKQ